MHMLDIVMWSQWSSTNNQGYLPSWYYIGISKSFQIYVLRLHLADRQPRRTPKKLAKVKHKTSSKIITSTPARMPVSSYTGSAKHTNMGATTWIYTPEKLP